LLEILQPAKIYGCKAASMDGEAPAALAATKQERRARNGPHEGAPLYAAATTVIPRGVP